MKPVADINGENPRNAPVIRRASSPARLPYRDRARLRNGNHHHATSCEHMLASDASGDGLLKQCYFAGFAGFAVVAVVAGVAGVAGVAVVAGVAGLAGLVGLVGLRAA